MRREIVPILEMLDRLVNPVALGYNFWLKKLKASVHQNLGCTDGSCVVPQRQTYMVLFVHIVGGFGGGICMKMLSMKLGISFENLDRKSSLNFHNVPA